jgi:aminoglycoside phosphotransferase family enzyme/predicted kinase
MITEDQRAVIELLGTPDTHAGKAVERIDTHSAVVFLAGSRAWKLKRAVRYDYLDFSTAARRKSMCEAEVRLNRRTAPTLYRGVVAVTREPDGSLALGGTGTPVDWVVEMERFDQEALFDRLAARARLGLGLMPLLAASIARFHQAAEHRDDHGGKVGMNWVVDGNAIGFAEYGTGVFEPSACFRVIDDACAELDRWGPLLDARREAGFVRQCHGDLYLRNIVLLESGPTLFDAVEFNDDIACIDVLYDLAFLLMDLWRRELPRHANAVWNGYLAESNDLEGIPLMPLFLSCRAAVRAKTSATAAQLQSNAERVGELQQLARDYLTMAERLLHPPPARLVAIGGLSRSGKSTLALALAPSLGSVPGAVVLRSDEVRKRLLGVPPFQRLGAEGYTAEMSSRVYATLAERARTVIRGGCSVIVDAVYARPSDREAIQGIAAAAAVPFSGLWLDAPDATLIERAARRRLDPSDADESVIRMQRSQDLGVIDWHRLDASLPADQVLQSAMARLLEADLLPSVPADGPVSRARS